MIILDERQFLEKELESKGFGIFDFFENHEVMSMKAFTSLELKRRSDFIIVDTETILKHPELQENFKSVLNTFLGAVFFHDHSNSKAQDWVKNEGAFLSKIIGEYALPMDQLHWTILTNQLQFFWSLIEDQKKLQKHISQFSIELDQVLQEAESEMIRAKKIHETLIPRRSEDIKGILITNKYAAGDGGGAEFYDLVQTPSKLFHIMVSSQSYLISSAIMGILSQHREKDFSPKDFINDTLNEIATINSAKKKKSVTDILVLEIDLGNLQLKSHSTTKSEFYSQLNGKITLAADEHYQLTKGEKVVVLSSGFLFNWIEGQRNSTIAQYLKDHANKSPAELMSELFFEIKETSKTEFLKKDATVVMMEVNRHGIHKI